MVNYNILSHKHMTTNLHRFYWDSTKLWFRKNHSTCFKLSDHIREMKNEGYPQFQACKEPDFRALHIMPLMNIVVNIKWLKPHHWKHMVLEQNLLDQTRMIVKKWVFVTDDDYGIGPVTNYAMFLMEYIASNLSKRKYGRKYVRYCKRNLKDLSLILQLKLKGFGKEFKMNVNKIEKPRWSEWHSKEECTRMECKNSTWKCFSLWFFCLSNNGTSCSTYSK